MCFSLPKPWTPRLGVTAQRTSDATSSVDPDMENLFSRNHYHYVTRVMKEDASVTLDEYFTSNRRLAYVRLCWFLTPSGWRSTVPVALAAPAEPILPSDDPDFVWDVFYHRAGLTNTTPYVDPISSFRLLEVNSKLAGRVYPTHW
jgi:hypothetical protein